MNPVRPPEPPKPPEVLSQESEVEQKPKASDELVPGLDLPQELFAEAAILSPVDWTEDELDSLQNMFEGEAIDPDMQAELVEKLTYTSPPHTPRPLVVVPDSVNAVSESPMISTPPPVIPLEVPTSRVNLDDWLKENKT